MLGEPSSYVFPLMMFLPCWGRGREKERKVMFSSARAAITKCHSLGVFSTTEIYFLMLLEASKCKMKVLAGFGFW